MTASFEKPFCRTKTLSSLVCQILRNIVTFQSIFTVLLITIISLLGLSSLGCLLVFKMIHRITVCLWCSVSHIHIRWLENPSVPHHPHLPLPLPSLCPNCILAPGKMFFTFKYLYSCAVITQQPCFTHHTSHFYSRNDVYRRAHHYQILTVLPASVFPLRYIGKSDSITISVWNHKKIHKKQGAGFLGCVRLLSNAINRLKDTGCKCQS